MLLYQFSKGTNPRRVIIYLAEKGIDIPRYELDYANGEHRTSRYRSIIPAGQTPTLVTDSGFAITESGSIVEYLEELYPDQPMIGSEPLERARVRTLAVLGNDLVARGQLWLWNRIGAFPAKERVPSWEAAERMHGYVSELLDVLEKEIGENPFLAGAVPTIADCATFPIFQTARERFDLSFGNGHPRLNVWYERFRARSSAEY